MRDADEGFCVRKKVAQSGRGDCLIFVGLSEWEVARKKYELFSGCTLNVERKKPGRRRKRSLEVGEVFAS